MVIVLQSHHDTHNPINNQLSQRYEMIEFDEDENGGEFNIQLHLGPLLAFALIPSPYMLLVTCRRA